MGEGDVAGVVWDDLVTKEKNRWLYYYLEETLKSTDQPSAVSFSRTPAIPPTTIPSGP